jgi:hypothetical protein
MSARGPRSTVSPRLASIEQLNSSGEWVAPTGIEHEDTQVLGLLKTSTAARHLRVLRRRCRERTGSPSNSEGGHFSATRKGTAVRDGTGSDRATDVLCRAMWWHLRLSEPV